MKRGDKVPVTIAGQTVANAEVRETGDGTVTLIVPATMVVMATRTELAVETPAPVSESESQILGVERTSGEPVSAPVGEPSPTPTTEEKENDSVSPETEEAPPASVENPAPAEVPVPSTESTVPPEAPSPEGNSTEAS